MGSALVRKLLADGNVKEVKDALGRFYEVEGVVVTGSRLGHTLSIPTANLHARSDYVLVKDGVYAVIVTIDGKLHQGICNLGYNPSFNYQSQRRFEVHILGLQENLYGKALKVSFVERLRAEQKFDSVTEFRNQIKIDQELAQKILAPWVKAQ